jgi:hypothetical protein
MRQGIQASAARRLATSLPGQNFPSTRSQVFLESVPANVLKIDHVLCDHHERVIRRARNFQLAGNIFESVRLDKASRAETLALVVSPYNRSLRRCRPAEHELPSARLKLPVCQSADKHSSGDSRTTTDARERNEWREGCASVVHPFAVASLTLTSLATLKKGLRGDRERKASYV